MSIFQQKADFTPPPSRRRIRFRLRRRRHRLLWRALDYIATEHKKDASKATVKAAVSIGPREKGGFGLAVVLDVTDTSLAQAELQSLAEEAHEKICPYSHATRGNVDVKVVTHGA